MTILPLNDILQILYKHCTENSKGLIDIKFNHKVVGVSQDEGKAWADVEVEQGENKRFEADFVIGCDGGSSTVRKCLFGRNWPGQTFDCRLLVQNVGQQRLSIRMPLTSNRSGMTGLKSMAGMEGITWFVPIFILSRLWYDRISQSLKFLNDLGICQLRQ